MRAMADAGCVEIRFGIESGSNRILERVKKGFTVEQAMDVVSRAVLSSGGSTPSSSGASRSRRWRTSTRRCST